MFYNETPSASGQTLTFDVNPQPGDVIQFVSPVTNISTEAYTAIFSTGESFPIMYGGEELVQAYLLYSGQTYLAVFTGNGLEITAQQAADAQGNTVNTAPYVINTFLDPAYSGLLTEQMQALASLGGDGTKLTSFTVPVTMTAGLSVTGDMSISSGTLAVAGTASAAAGTSGTELVNYTQMTDGSLSPTLDSIQINGSASLQSLTATTATLSGAVVAESSVQLNSNWANGSGIMIGSNPAGTAGIMLNAPLGYTGWLEQLMVDGTTMWNVTQSGDVVAAGTVSAAAGTANNELVNITQIINGSLSPAFGQVTLSPATGSSQAVAFSQLGNLNGFTYIGGSETLPETAYGTAIQVPKGAVVTLPTSNVDYGLLYFYTNGTPYSIISSPDQSIYCPQLGMSDTTGPSTLNCPNGEDVLLLYRGGGFNIIGGSILVTQAVNQTFGHPLSVPAGTTGTEVVNYAQTAFLTEKSLSAATTAGNQTITAAQMVGSYFADSATQTAAYALTTDTAANLLGALPAAQVGTSFTLRVINDDQSSTGYAMTLAAGSGVTISTALPNPSVGKGLWADYLCTFTAIGASAAVTVVCVS